LAVIYVDGSRMFLFVLIMSAVSFWSYSYMISAPNLRWLAVPPCISVLALFVIRFTLERGEPNIFDFWSQSWALIIGDPILITLALYFANHSWIVEPGENGKWFYRRSWTWVSLAGGYLLAGFWNLVLDAPNYVAAGHGDLLMSPSHIWHGWVTFPVLSATLINYGVPVILKWWRTKFALLFVLALVGYILTSVADATIHPLDVTDLHPPVSQTWLAG
jgi:hypothetical protein